MRSVLALVLLAALAAGDGEEAVRRFRAAYRDDVPAAARKEALLELARADAPEAAEVLFEVFERLEKDSVRLRRDLFGVRSKIRDLRRRERAGRAKPEETEERVRELDGRDVELNARLAVLEAERAAILEGIAGLEEPATLAWLAKTGLDRARSPLLLRAAAERVVAEAEDGAAVLLVALERARDVGEVVALLDALAAHGAKIGAPGLPAVIRRLSDRDGAVRAAAARAIARAAQPEGVAALVHQVRREPERSRTQREMLDALRVLTGANPGDDAATWAAWWRDHEEEVLSGKALLGQGKPAPAKSDQGRFYGIPQVEERIVYVLDSSGSMIVSLQNPKFVAGGPVAARDDEDSRFDAASRELLRAAKSLRRDARYTVIAYSDHAELLLSEELEPATPERHADLGEVLTRLGPVGQTNIYEALDLALRVAGVHPEGPRGPARADAIYLISDGSPTNAKGELEDPERTLQAVREWNALRRVVVHAIGIGAEHNSVFLRRLAEENGGTYYAVVP